MILVANMLLAAPAVADIVATCGASKGHGYFPPSVLVPKDEAGWQEEAISSGSFQLIRSGDEYDIVYTDATGRTLSSKADGAKVTAFTDAAGNLVVITVYEDLIETWVFWLSIKSERIVTFAQAKHSTLIPKHTLMKADCSW